MGTSTDADIRAHVAPCSDHEDKYLNIHTYEQVNNARVVCDPMVK